MRTGAAEHDEERHARILAARRARAGHAHALGTGLSSVEVAQIGYGVGAVTVPLPEEELPPMGAWQSETFHRPP